MPTLAVGMLRFFPRFHHAHGKRGHGTGHRAYPLRRFAFGNLLPLQNAAVKDGDPVSYRFERDDRRQREQNDRQKTGKFQ